MNYPDVTILYSGARWDTGGDGNFAIFVDSEEDYRVAETVKDVLALLSGIYEMPFWKKAGEELTRVYEELGEEEYYRRLGIGIAPGEEK